MQISTARPSSSPLVEVCAWCVGAGLVAQPPGPNVTHGICPAHALEVLAQGAVPFTSRLLIPTPPPANPWILDDVIDPRD